MLAFPRRFITLNFSMEIALRGMARGCMGCAGDHTRCNFMMSVWSAGITRILPGYFSIFDKPFLVCDSDALAVSLVFECSLTSRYAQHKQMQADDDVDDEKFREQRRGDFCIAILVPDSVGYYVYMIEISRMAMLCTDTDTRFAMCETGVYCEWAGWVGGAHSEWATKSWGCGKISGR